MRYYATRRYTASPICAEVIFATTKPMPSEMSQGSFAGTFECFGRVKISSRGVLFGYLGVIHDGLGMCSPVPSGNFAVDGAANDRKGGEADGGAPDVLAQQRGPYPVAGTVDPPAPD